MAINYSPVNFFDSDIEKYPRFNDIDKKYFLLLEDGDCAFIPSFTFYQYIGVSKRNEVLEGNENVEMSTSLILKLKYKNNSGLLEQIFSAIEENIIT